MKGCVIFLYNFQILSEIGTMEEVLEIKEEIGEEVEISDVELDEIEEEIEVEEEIEISDVEPDDIVAIEGTSEKREKRGSEEEGDFTAFDEDGNWFRINTSIIPNPLTLAKAEVEIAPDERFYEALLKFQKGYTMFALIMQWGLLDQKCLKLWRLMRLMAFLNMLKPFGSNYQYIGSVTVQIVKILKEIKREYTLMRTRYRKHQAERARLLRVKRRIQESHQDRQQKYRFVVMREVKGDEERVKNPYVIKK